MDLNFIKQKMATMQKTSEGGKGSNKDLFWKPPVGKSQIRIVPSRFDQNNPFKELFFYYGIDKPIMISPTNFGEKDPIVEFVKQLRGTSDKDNWRLAKKLDPKMRVFAPVIVRGEEDKGVRLWEFGKEIYLQLLGLAEDEDYGDFTDISEGFDFTLEALMGDIGGRQGLKSSIRPKRKTSALSEDASQIEMWLEEQPDILEMQAKFKKSFDELKTILQNFLEPEGEEEEEMAPTPTESIDEELNLEPKSNYSLSAKKEVAKPVDKFDSLFDEEDDDMPF